MYYMISKFETISPEVVNASNNTENFISANRNGIINNGACYVIYVSN